jgi:hypothetical protein
MLWFVRGTSIDLFYLIDFFFGLIRDCSREGPVGYAHLFVNKKSVFNKLPYPAVHLLMLMAQSLRVE